MFYVAPLVVDRPDLLAYKHTILEMTGGHDSCTSFHFANTSSLLIGSSDTYVRATEANSDGVALAVDIKSQ